MNEWLMICIMVWCGCLFAAGGTDLNGKGYKQLRRYLMPFRLSIVVSYFAIWWQVAIYTILLSAVLHPGYGSKCSWPMRICLFVGYGAVALVFGWQWWTVFTPATLSLLFLASNTYLTAKSVFWKAWEFLAGVLISFGFIASLLNKW